MKKPLYLKFIFAYLVFGILSFLTISLLSSRILYNYLLQKQGNAVYQEAFSLAAYCSDQYYSTDLGAGTFAQLRPQLAETARRIDGTIWIMDRSGTVTFDSSSQHTGSLLTKFDATQLAGKYQVGDFFGTYSQPVISSVSSIAGDFSFKGYIAVHIPLSGIQSETDRILNIIYITGGIIYLLSLSILAVFFFTVQKPVKKITVAAMEYAEGNLKYQIDVKSDDEMGYLASTLNYMSSELDNMGEYQKKFIANVSHDFRSPLTSIKGYIEAILDGTIPVEIQDKYLNIVISETERLNKLTKNMLSLNSLNSKGAYLERTDFDINQVIKNTCATFEGQCQDKGIIFELNFAEKSQMVNADMTKIQQVLYNLIDNALKFSHPNSTIWIDAYRQYDKTFVSVRDSGIGIPKDSLKKIWDRFYKIDASRGKDKRGTGLGLSIAREIIQAHEEKIDVISTEGAGTEFIFTLANSERD